MKMRAATMIAPTPMDIYSIYQRNFYWYNNEAIYGISLNLILRAGDPIFTAEFLRGVNPMYGWAYCFP